MKEKSVLMIFQLCILFLICFMNPLKASAAQGVMTDDEKVEAKLKIQEHYFKNVKVETLYDEAPSIIYPYSTGRLNSAFLERGLNAVNYYRLIVGLPSVKMSNELNELSQYGAVVLAANNFQTHYPEQPEDMPDDFFENAYQATRKSNLCTGYGGELALSVSVFAYMQDVEGSNENPITVGHRRAIIHPNFENVGFGYAEATDGTPYVVTYVSDYNNDIIDYDYISCRCAKG